MVNPLIRELYGKRPIKEKEQMTKDKLIKWLEDWRLDLENCGWSLRDEKVYEELCNLIEQGKPKITKEEFMESSCELWGEETSKGFREKLKECLERLGMEVGDE